MHKSLQGTLFDYYDSGKTITVSVVSKFGVTIKSSTAPNTSVAIPISQGVAIMSCVSSHHISCCILGLSYMTRHEGSKLITFKLLQFFGCVFNALFAILIYHKVYVLTKNCYNIVYLERYRFKFKCAACVTIQIKKYCFNNGRNSALYLFSSSLVVIKTVYILSLTQKHVTIQ